MKINHISVSRAETYTQCNQKYKYRYELGILPEKTPFHFTFGKIAHKIIEEYTKSRGEADFGTIAKSVLSGEVDLEPGVKAPRLEPKDLNRLNEHIANFAKLSEKIGTSGEVEFPFEVDLDPPNKKMWVGFIDRLIQKNDKFFIIDYKTTKPGKWRKDKITIRKDLQIKGYCFVIREKFKVPAANIQAALYYLEDDQLVSSGTFSEEELDSVPKNLLQMFNEIQLKDPDTVVGKTGDHCRMCEYKDHCPFFKSWRNGMSFSNYGR